MKLKNQQRKYGGQKSIREPLFQDGAGAAEIQSNLLKQFLSAEGGQNSSDAYHMIQRTKKSSRFCCGSKSKVGKLSFEDACIHLFQLIQPNIKECGHKDYFQDASKDQFVDILNQLSSVSPLKEDMIIWVQDISGNIKETMGRQLQFKEYQKSLMEEESGNRRKSKTKGKFSVWLNEMKKPMEEYVLNQFPTHQIIWDLLFEARSKDLLNAEMLNYLLYYRETMLDAFLLLDEDHDQKLRKLTLGDDQKWMNGDIQSDFLETIESYCDQQQDSKHFKKWLKMLDEQIDIEIQYHDFQKYLWTALLDYGFDFEKFQQELYDKKVGCLSICKNSRHSKMRIRLKSKREQSATVPLKLLYGDILHILDIFTDGHLAKTMYDNSKIPHDELETDFVHGADFKICFVWIAMAIFGPSIIQYSSYMNLLYHKGIYQHENYSQESCAKRMCLLLSLTWLGLVVIPLIDLLIKLENIINVILIPFTCCKKNGRSLNERIRLRIRLYIQGTLEMNDFEIENFKQQSKFTQMIFEDFLMILLDVFVVAGVFKVPGVKDINKDANILLFQIGTTSLSVYSVLSTLFFQSQALRENKLEYLLICLKAKQSWIPFGNIFEKNELKQDINFGNFELKKNSGIINSDTMGTYYPLDFKFSNLTLKILSKQIQTQKLFDSSNNKTQEIKQKKGDPEEQQKENDNFQGKQFERVKENIMNYNTKFYFGSSLDSVSAHQFLSFMDTNQTRNMDHVLNNFNFDNVNWYLMVENSFRDQNRRRVPMTQPMTDFGHPLLQVCIDNEESIYEREMNGSDKKLKNEGKWQLKELMRRLLVQYKCDPNVFDSFNEYTLISYCTKNRKIQALKMIISLCKDNLDINKLNPNKTSFYSFLLTNCKNEYHQIILKFVIAEVGDKIDFHKPQIKIGQQQMFTPIQNFLHTHQDNKFKDLNDVFESEDWQKCFPLKTFKLTNTQEVMQIFEYSLSNQSHQQICHQLLETIEGDQNLVRAKQQFQKNHQENLDSFGLEYKMQESIPFQESLIEKQMSLRASTFKPVEYSVFSRHKKNVNSVLLRVLLTVCIEISSFFDLLSDFIILKDLAFSPDTAWFSFSLFTMLCPYYTIYTSLINYQIQQIQKKMQQKKNSRSCCFLLFNTITILPTMLVILILLDIIFIITSIIVYPVILMFSGCKIGERMLSCYETIQNKLLNQIFGLSHMEIEGFRSQRTILQFQLESIPQIFFQMYILMRLRDLNRESDKKQLGLSEETVIFSIYCAIFHIIFEFINIVVEARTSESAIMHYVVACYNSREKWIPRQHYFQSQVPLVQGQARGHMIEIDRPGLFCGGRLSYSIGFKFTDQSLTSLMQLISTKSTIRPDLRSILLIDECFNDIGPIKIIELGILAYGKLFIQYTEPQLKRIKHQIESDSTIMQMIRDPENFDSFSDEYLVHLIVKSNQHQILEILIDLDAKLNISSKKDAKTSIVQAALAENNYESITLLHDNRIKLDLIITFFRDILENNVHAAGSYKIPASKVEFEPYLIMISSIFFDPFKMINSGQQMFHTRQIVIDIMEKKLEEAHIKFLTLHGAYILSNQLLIGIKSQFDLNRLHKMDHWNKQWESYIEMFHQWSSMIPSEIRIMKDDLQEILPSSFISQFVIFRQVYFVKYIQTLSNQGFTDFINLDGLCQFSDNFKPQDFKMIYKVIKGEKLEIDCKQLFHLDQLIGAFGLDKERDIYFKKSRACLSVSDRQNAFQINKKTAKELKFFKIPRNCIGLRSMKVQTVNPDHHAIKCKFIQLLDNTRFGDKFNLPQKNVADAGDDKDSGVLLSFHTDDSERYSDLNMHDFEHYKLYRFFETLFNNLKGGNMFASLCFKDQKDKNVECNFEFEFFRKVDENGLFVESDDIKNVQSDFNANGV